MVDLRRIPAGHPDLCIHGDMLHSCRKNLQKIPKYIYTLDLLEAIIFDYFYGICASILYSTKSRLHCTYAHDVGHFIFLFNQTRKTASDRGSMTIAANTSQSFVVLPPAFRGKTHFGHRAMLQCSWRTASQTVRCRPRWSQAYADLQLQPVASIEEQGGRTLLRRQHLE